MKWYGSLTNRIEERARSKQPEIGMPVTEYCYTDRHAYEIIEIKDSRHIIVRAYKTERIDNNGMSESQKYNYISCPDMPTANLFLTSAGVWRERYGSRKLGSETWVLGIADEYYDYSF